MLLYIVMMFAWSYVICMKLFLPVTTKVKVFVIDFLMFLFIIKLLRNHWIHLEIQITAHATTNIIFKRFFFVDILLILDYVLVNNVV